MGVARAWHSFGEGSNNAKSFLGNVDGFSQLPTHFPHQKPQNSTLLGLWQRRGRLRMAILAASPCLRGSLSAMAGFPGDSKPASALLASARSLPAPLSSPSSRREDKGFIGLQCKKSR